MGGAITHIGISLLGFLIGKFIFKKYTYGLAFLFGSVVPDLIDFGLLTIYLGHFDYYGHMAHPWFDFLSMLGHTWWHWFILTGILFIFSSLLYWFKFISIAKLKFFYISLAFFLIAVQLHLLIDLLVIETYWWL